MGAMAGFMIAAAGTALVIYALMTARESRPVRRSSTSADGTSGFGSDSSDAAWGFAWLGGAGSDGDRSGSCSSDSVSGDMGSGSGDCGGGGGGDGGGGGSGD